MLLLNENNGFSYEEMLRMPMEILIGFYNVKEKILEERKKEEEESENQSPNVPSVSSLMSQARSSFKMPSASSIMSSIHY